MEDLINIAYDRKNELYVGYNVETGIVATGNCVESARAAYTNALYARLAQMAQEDHAESQKHNVEFGKLATPLSENEVIIFGV